jgi:phospholipid transport system substrate-binding protein
MQAVIPKLCVDSLEHVMTFAIRTTLLGALLALAASGVSAQIYLPPLARPDALMKTVTAEVIAEIKEDRAAGRATDMAQLLERRILPLFDFNRMTSLAMGRYWTPATPEQQAALVTQFRLLLVHTYATALTGLHEQLVTYRPLREPAGAAEVQVRSTLKRPGTEPVAIDYDMAESVSGWRIFDVRIAGVSLVLNYRESFASAIRRDGVEGLIRTLGEKNRQNDAARKAPPRA